MANQLIVDLYGCDPKIIDDLDRLRQVAHGAIHSIRARIVEECSHRFLPVGITYIAVITTSHFSIHTWPEYQYAAVDIFSCDESVPSRICEYLKRELGSEYMKVRQFERQLQRKEVP